MSPTVTALAIHLENKQNVVFHDGDDLQAVRNAEHPTQLTEWLRYNADHPDDEDAKNLTYADFPEKFAWRQGCKGMLLYRSVVISVIYIYF
jgi:hypothetical protein